MKRFMIADGIAMLVVACEKNEQTAAPKSGKSFTSAVIPQGSTHEFWKSIHAGAMKTAQDEAKAGVNVTIIWKGPMREDDREQQVQVVEGFVTQHVDGIVLAPFDKNALVRPVEEAKRAGIPTVVVDSGLESADPISFVASNNSHGGELAADEMGRLLGGRGKVLALEDAGKAGKIRFIGFDTSEVFIKAMRDGKLHGIVVQNPFRMGELGVKTVVDHLLGNAVEKRIDTGVTLITPANLDAPESQTLLHPPLETYLK
jgi:ABC-type sugar transport system substrate-binding protein